MLYIKNKGNENLSAYWTYAVADCEDDDRQFFSLGSKINKVRGVLEN